MGITLPVVLLLFDFLQKRNFSKDAINDKIPFFIVSVLILIINLAALRLPNSRGAMSAGPVSWDSFLIAAHGIIFYLKQLFLPIRLSFLYPYPDKINGLLPPIYLFSPAIVVFLAIIILLLGRYTRKLAFGGMFFLVTIFPVLQLIPLSPVIAADRYTYIPSIGVFYIVGECSAWLYKNKRRHGLLPKSVLAATFIVIIACLSFLTYKRAKVWQNSIILWSDALKAYPDSAIAYANRGGAYAQIGKFEQAISDCNKAVELNPNEVNVYTFRAGAYISTGKFEQAISDCNKAISLNPGFSRAYYNRAVAYFFKQEYIKSRQDLDMARSLGYKIPEDFLQALKQATDSQVKKDYLL
jgi:tetratricopeptide (TPR) repeat protein